MSLLSVFRVMGNELTISPSKLPVLNGHSLDDLAQAQPAPPAATAAAAAVAIETDDRPRAHRFRARSQRLSYRLKWPTHVLVETETNSESSSVASGESAQQPKRRGRKRGRSQDPHQPASPSPPMEENGHCPSTSSSSLNGSFTAPKRSYKRRRRAASPSAGGLVGGEEEVDPLLAPPSYPLPNLHRVMAGLVAGAGQRCPFAYTWDAEEVAAVRRVREARAEYRRKRACGEMEVTPRRKSGKAGGEDLPKVVARLVDGAGVLLEWDP